jgi:hypothetical protein
MDGQKCSWYSQDRSHPVAVELNGHTLPDEWPLCQLSPDSDVRIYPVPYGTGLEIAVWVSVAISAASAVYSLFFGPKVDLGGYSSGSGRSLELNPAKANTAKLGDPIREVFGRCRIYPDYLVQPVTRFDPDDPTRMTVEMFLCVGQGDFRLREEINGLEKPRQPRWVMVSAIRCTSQERTYLLIREVKTGSTRQKSAEHQAEQGWIWPRPRLIPTILLLTA